MRQKWKEAWQDAKEEPGWAIFLLGAVATLGIIVYDKYSGADDKAIIGAMIASGLIILAGFHESMMRS